MELRMWLDETGRLLPRGLSADDVVLVGAGLQSGRAVALGAVPAGHQGEAAGLLDEVAVWVAKVDAGRSQALAPKSSPPPIPESLRGVAGEDELGSARGLNYTIDQQVGALASVLSGFAQAPQGHPMRLAADALNSAWFPDGRGFLSATNEGQWLAVARRLETSRAPDLAQAAAQLQVQGSLEVLGALNQRFGWFLGLLDEGTSTQQALATAQTRADLEAATQRANEALHRLLVFAQRLWPSDADADAAGRRVLLAPYLDALFERSRAHGRRVREGNRADRPEPM